jgi:transcriptional regulator with XRE-family HTH domain
VSAKKIDSRDIAIGQRIRARRLTSGLSQVELADSLGISFQQVQKYEKGVNRVGSGRLQRIAEVLEVPVAFFFSEGNEAEAPSAGNPVGLEFLTTARSVRLIKAYSRIKDTKLQEKLVDLVEQIAGSPARGFGMAGDEKSSPEFDNLLRVIERGDEAGAGRVARGRGPRGD